MGLRFRKRVKLFPGLWLNLSKSGVSTSVGTNGLTVNLKGDKARTTVSAPGTGISYSVTEETGDAAGGGHTSPLVWLCLAAALFTLAVFLFS